MLVNLSFMAVLTSDLAFYNLVPIRLSGYWKCCKQFGCRNPPLLLSTYKNIIWFH